MALKGHKRQDQDVYRIMQAKASASLFNSSIMLTSSSFTAASTSSFLTNPAKLQDPRHKRACVEATDRRLYVCERTSWPQLKRRSTSTEVADAMSVRGNRSIACKHTGNTKIVQGHTKKARVCLLFLMPPLNGIFDIFQCSSEVQHKFINDLSIAAKRDKWWEVVEYVFLSRWLGLVHRLNWANTS